MSDERSAPAPPAARPCRVLDSWPPVGVASSGGMPSWVLKQVRCELAPLPDDDDVLLLMPTAPAETLRQIALLRESAPTQRVRLVADPTVASALAVLAAHGEDDWLPFRCNVRRELARPRATAGVSAAAWGRHRPMGFDSAFAVLTTSGYALNACQLAGELGCSERTLRRQFADAGLPAVKDVIGRGRAAIARYLVVHGIGATATAAALRYSSPAAFATKFRRDTGLSPREYLREHRAREAAEHADWSGE